MNRVEMLAELRTKIDDVSARPKWTDRELLGFLAEGQDKLCEETGYFVDVTSHTLDTIVDQAIYDIPARIISILDIWNGNRRLGRYQEYLKTFGAGPSDTVLFSPDSSTPYCWQADQETGLITILPTPNEIVTLTLRVWRYSLFALDDEDIDGADTPAEPELPNRLQRGCIAWAAFKAYSDHDAEKGDPVKASDHLGEFRMYVTDGKKMIRRYQSETYKTGGNPCYTMC